MVSFAVIGTVLTLLIFAGGAFAWWHLGRQPTTRTIPRRHRAEAQQVQSRFDLDEDFARNFHRPTQNEVLETLQMLDHLAPQWDQGDAVLVDHHLKNELAESFPALRKTGCSYPVPPSDDAGLAAPGGRRSAGRRADQLRKSSEAQARAREEFRAVRAQANALHQLTSGADNSPLELVPGSLPFRVSNDVGSTRSAWVPKLIGVSVFAACLALAGWYAMADGARWHGFKAMITGSTANPVTAPVPGSETEPAPTVSPPPAVAQGDAAPTKSPATTATQQSIAAAATSPNPPALIATSASTPTPPPTVPAAGKPTPSAEAVLAQEVASSQLRAIDQYPELAVPNSEINLRFVFRYKNLLAEKSPRLQDPRWPEELADECATAAIPAKGRKVTQTATPHR